MKHNKIILLLFVLAFSLQGFAKSTEYVVVAGKNILSDKEWSQVARTLTAKHHATLITYQNTIDDILPQLKQINPRYVAIVEKPENLNKQYIITLNQLSRKVDKDIYADFLWGIITGYTAQSAMKMVNQSATPFVMKDALSTIHELKSAKWFDRLGYVDDSQRGGWGEKDAPDHAVTSGVLSGADLKSEEMTKFYDLYKKYDPDVIVTASHATEYNLEMPYSLGNVKSKNGQLYMDIANKPLQLPVTSKRRVYLPIGNCLIGDIDNTRESMAVAWMNTGNAVAMVGYVVETWYGRSGWGMLKYMLTNPGRYTIAEACFMNQQDMLYQMNEWNPYFVTGAYPMKNTDYESFAQALGKQLTKDQMGFLYDRDVLVYYGDPKWDARLKEIPEESDYQVTSTLKGKKCIVTITTSSNFSLERMKGDKFKTESVLDLPFSYFFPRRLNNPRMASGQKWKVAVNKDFLLIYNADFEPSKTYQITLDID